MTLMLFAIGNTAHSAMLNNFVAHYSLDARSQSLISAAVSAGMFVSLCLVLTGVMRLRRPAVLIAAAAAVSAMFALLGTEPPFWLFIACYFVVGFSFGLIDTSTSSVTADLYAERGAEKKMGLLHSFFGVGGVAGPLIIGRLLSSGSRWSAVMLVFSAVAAVVALYSVVVYMVTRSALGVSDARPEKISLGGLRSFLNAGNSLFILAVGLKGAQEVCLAFWVARYISAGLGNAALGPIAISLMWLGSALSRVTVPSLPFKTNAYIIVSMIFSSAVLAAALLFPSAAAMCAASLAVGLVSGAVVPLGISSICRSCPENTLMASTCALLCIYALQASSAFLTGLIFGELLSAGIITAAVCGLAGAAFAAAASIKKRQIIKIKTDKTA